MTKKDDELTIRDNQLDDFGELDLTPARAQVRMPEETYVAIKIICAKKQIFMREFYYDAFQALVKRRAEWDEEANGRFVYKSPLKTGKLVSLAVFEHHFEEINEMADRDGMYHRAAYFTAIIEHIERVNKEINS